MTTEQKDVDTSLATKIDTAGGATPPGIATGYEGTAADQFRAYVARVRSGDVEGRYGNVASATTASTCWRRWTRSWAAVISRSSPH